MRRRDEDENERLRQRTVPLRQSHTEFTSELDAAIRRGDNSPSAWTAAKWWVSFSKRVLSPWNRLKAKMFAGAEGTCVHRVM
jgi:hypothetical protein